MKKDSLKKFVEENKEAFYHRDPSEVLWDRIKDHLPVKEISLWNNTMIWRVAAMLFLGLSIYLFATQNVVKTPNQESAKLQGEFSDLESFYSEQILEKVELINHIQNFNDQEKFTQDLEKLEAMYLVLKEQMKINPTEKVKDALILNFLVRMDLLNQQIKNIEDSRKKEENKDKETSV
jgi:hypothetical protein